MAVVASAPSLRLLSSKTISCSSGHLFTLARAVLSAVVGLVAELSLAMTTDAFGDIDVRDDAMKTVLLIVPGTESDGVVITFTAWYGAGSSCHSYTVPHADRQECWSAT